MPDQLSRNLLFLLGGALLALCGGAAIAATASLDGFWFFLGLVALSTATIGVLAVLASRSRDALSPLGLTAASFLLGYVAGGVYYWVNPRPSTPLLDVLPFPPTHPNLTSAIWIATFAWITFAIGYWLNPLKHFVRAVPRLPSSRSVRSVSLLVAPLFVGGWAARIDLIASGRYFHLTLDEVAATPSTYVIFILSTLPIVATAFVGAYHYLNRDRLDSNRYRNAFFALAAIEFIWTIPSGTRGDTLVVVMMVLAVGYYGTSGAIRVSVAVAAAVLVVFIVFPFALYYRNNPTDYRLSPGKALSNAADVTLDRLPTQAPADGLAATFSRFSNVASLSEIVRRQPTYSGRAPGETLAWTAESLVPRAILPSKEDPGLFGHEFGSTYGLISPRNLRTSVAVTQPGELYINFGVPGMLLMLAVGAVYRAIGDYLGARGDDPAVLAIYASLAFPILQSHDTILANGLTGVLKMLVTFSVVVGVAITLTTRRRTFSARGHTPRGDDSPPVRALPGRAANPG